MFSRRRLSFQRRTRHPEMYVCIYIYIYIYLAARRPTMPGSWWSAASARASARVGHLGWTEKLARRLWRSLAGKQQPASCFFPTGTEGGSEVRMRDAVALRSRGSMRTIPRQSSLCEMLRCSPALAACCVPALAPCCHAARQRHSLEPGLRIDLTDTPMTGDGGVVSSSRYKAWAGVSP